MGGLLGYELVTRLSPIIAVLVLGTGSSYSVLGTKPAEAVVVAFAPCPAKLDSEPKLGRRSPNPMFDGIETTLGSAL